MFTCTILLPSFTYCRKSETAWLKQMSQEPSGICSTHHNTCGHIRTVFFFKCFFSNVVFSTTAFVFIDKAFACVCLQQGDGVQGGPGEAQPGTGRGAGRVHGPRYHHRP